MKKLVIEKGTVGTMKEANSVLYYDTKENRAWARSYYSKNNSMTYNDDNVIAISILPDDFLNGAQWSRKLIEESIKFHMDHIETYK